MARHRVSPVSQECRRRLAHKLRAKGNERLPFAWRVVLCEGETDVEAIRGLAERCGIDLHARNVAVADCGDRENLPDYARFCGELGLQHLVVMDGDATKAEASPKVASMAQKVRDAVSGDPLGQLVEFSEDLETALGVDKQRSSLVPAAIRAVSLDPGGPAEIWELMEALCRLVGSAPVERS